jgi:hypothetical protein
LKRRTILLLVVLAMVALVGGAVAWDCVRIAANHRERIALADDELKKHEDRLVGLLGGSTHTTPEVQAAIDAHGAAKERPARHAAYDELVVAFRKTASAEVDPTNPLDRKFMDDLAGAINRRDIARDPYDLEAAAYRKYLEGFRGRIARWISPQAEADWKANASP